MGLQQKRKVVRSPAEEWMGRRENGNSLRNTLCQLGNRTGTAWLKWAHCVCVHACVHVWHVCVPASLSVCLSACMCLYVCVCQLQPAAKGIRIVKWRAGFKWLTKFYCSWKSKWRGKREWIEEDFKGSGQFKKKKKSKKLLPLVFAWLAPSCGLVIHCRHPPFVLSCFETVSLCSPRVFVSVCVSVCVYVRSLSVCVCCHSFKSTENLIS